VDTAGALATFPVGMKTHGSASNTGRLWHTHCSYFQPRCRQLDLYRLRRIAHGDTAGARKASAQVPPVGGCSAVFGYIFLLAITLHLPDLTPLFPAVLDNPAVYSQYYWRRGGCPSHAEREP
jgi:hypothetical protein